MENNLPRIREYIGVYADVRLKSDSNIGCYGYNYNFLGKYFNAEMQFESIKNHLYQLDFLSIKNKIILIGEFDPENIFCFDRDQYKMNSMGVSIGAFKITEQMVVLYKQRFTKYYRESLSFMQKYVQKIDINFGVLLYFD